MSLEKSPDRGATAWNSLLAHRRNDLVQGQIRLFGYQSQQPFHVLLQRRRAPAAQLCSGASRQRCNHLTAELALRLKLSAASRRDAPAATASITRSRKSSE
jgi:ribosomal protein S7